MSTVKYVPMENQKIQGKEKQAMDNRFRESLKTWETERQLLLQQVLDEVVGRLRGESHDIVYLFSGKKITDAEILMRAGEDRLKLKQRLKIKQLMNKK